MLRSRGKRKQDVNVLNIATTGKSDFRNTFTTLVLSPVYITIYVLNALCFIQMYSAFSNGHPLLTASSPWENNPSSATVEILTGFMHLSAGSCLKATTDDIINSLLSSLCKYNCNDR